MIYSERGGPTAKDFDLSYINSPQQYALIFGIQHEFLKGNLLCHIQDGTNAFILPPPEFTIEFLNLVLLG